MKPPQIGHSEIEWYHKRARRERAETIARFLRVGIARAASALCRVVARVAQRPAGPPMPASCSPPTDR
jgi:hypothetical protein